MCWVKKAIASIEADYCRSADTHLIALPMANWFEAGIDFYLKDESTHPSGSLKHRLARSLFLYALCNGWLREGMTVVEASSGSTAVSEAYFARLLGLPFIAVVTKNTSEEKVEKIRAYSGECHFVEKPSEVYVVASQIAARCDGHYMDQFTYAERATDWRGNNNVAQSIFEQVACERFPVPKWIVVGAGTGGTSATIGRYIRYKRFASKLCVPDPKGSVFSDYFASGDRSLVSEGSKIEGIGRPRVEPSFIRTLIDKMIVVADEDSVGAMFAVSDLLGRLVGPSTGTNIVAMMSLAKAMYSRGETGSIVSLLCDNGERYRTTFHDTDWVTRQIGEIEAPRLKWSQALAHPHKL